MEIIEEKKLAYQAILNFAEELRSDVRIALERYGNRFKFEDVFYRTEFADLLFDYINGKITKDDLKEKIKEKLAYANAILR